MASDRDKSSDQTILLGLLDAVERGDVTQRGLSRELGIAVGLVNSYVRRCIKTGLIKVQQIPPRRYGYYLTPKGFVEKSRLVASYFVHSFDFFRRARASCEATLLNATKAGHKRIGLVGSSELAEIAVIVATEIDVQIVAIIDSNLKKPRILGIPAVKVQSPYSVPSVFICLRYWRTSSPVPNARQLLPKKERRNERVRAALVRRAHTSS
jgi:predicted transcriptional regulator